MLFERFAITKAKSLWHLDTAGSKQMLPFGSLVEGIVTLAFEKASEKVLRDI